MIELNNKILSDITVYMKYAKYIPELNRREKAMKEFEMVTLQGGSWEIQVPRRKNDTKVD